MICCELFLRVFKIENVFKQSIIPALKVSFKQRLTSCKCRSLGNAMKHSLTTDFSLL